MDFLISVEDEVSSFHEFDELTQFLISFVKQVESQNCYFVGKCQMVCDLAYVFAKKRKLNVGQGQELLAAAFFIDIDLYINQKMLLLKAEPLTDEERELITRHPQNAVALIPPFPRFSMVREVVLCHHEKWDGTGYPNRRKGEEIPLPARILSVCDTFSAMVSERPYRKALSFDAACSEIKSAAGTSFDPDVVKMFLEIVKGGEF